MVSGRREKIRQATIREIMDNARKQIAEQGAAALSLRAIARDMGMTAPALYRYFPSRDDLLTVLILETYNALGDTVEAAVNAVDPQDHRGRILAFTTAYRQWAIEHPQDYMFIFTTSVPGYDAPDEITVPAASRTMEVFAATLADAMKAGKVKMNPDCVSASPALLKAVAEAETRYGMQQSTLLVGLIGWSRLHGVIALEIFSHIGPVIGDVSELYAAEVNTLLKCIGLEGE